MYQHHTAFLFAQKHFLFGIVAIVCSLLPRHCWDNSLATLYQNSLAATKKEVKSQPKTPWLETVTLQRFWLPILISLLFYPSLFLFFGHSFFTANVLLVEIL